MSETESKRLIIPVVRIYASRIGRTQCLAVRLHPEASSRSRKGCWDEDLDGSFGIVTSLRLSHAELCKDILFFPVSF